MNIYDLIVFDLIIFCHSQKLMIPGTEDMIKEYRSPWPVSYTHLDVYKRQL